MSVRDSLLLGIAILVLETVVLGVHEVLTGGVVLL